MTPDAQENRIAELEELNERLRAALVRHGRHVGVCYATMIMPGGKHGPCTCGLDAALAAAGESEKAT